MKRSDIIKQLGINYLAEFSELETKQNNQSCLK